MNKTRIFGLKSRLSMIRDESKYISKIKNKNKNVCYIIPTAYNKFLSENFPTVSNVCLTNYFIRVNLMIFY